MKNLFTTNNAAVAEKDVYLGLLVIEIFSYSIGHNLSQKYVYPASISIDYARYQNKYWKHFNTCLKRFNGHSKERLEGENRELWLELIYEEIQDAIEGAVSLIKEKLVGIDIEKSNFENYSINLLSKSNELSHPNLLVLFKRILSNSKHDGNHVYIPEIGETRLNDFEHRVYAIAKAGLMIEALEFTKKRAALNDKATYMFKKQVQNIEEACENSLINSKGNILKAKHKDKGIAGLAKVVVNNNEIIGNRLYLIDKSGYQKAVEKHIKDNSEKYSFQDSN